jgi:2,6-dihydroxypseudooxynicotine hydrolase
MTKAVVDDIVNTFLQRFLADGVHYRDLMDIRAATPDWDSWPETWSQWAHDCEKRADESLATGARRTAADDLARASLYYHYGQNMLVDDLALKRKVHDKKVAAFMRAAPLLDPPLERVEIPFDGIKMAGYFRVPPGIKSPPCVVLMGGLDTTKEDYLTVNDYCLQRGLATLAFDGPGQGETQFDMLWRQDFIKAVYAVFDYVEKRPEIDPNRLGLVGRSTGGHYAALAPATDKRVKATVVWGAMYNLQNITEIPYHVLRNFMYISGTKTPAKAHEFFKCINLEGYAEKITCPMLVVHGGRDVVTPIENATRLMREARGEIETLIWDDSMHCCHDRSHIVRPRIADFMTRRL